MACAIPAFPADAPFPGGAAEAIAACRGRWPWTGLEASALLTGGIAVPQAGEPGALSHESASFAAGLSAGPGQIRNVVDGETAAGASATAPGSRAGARQGAATVHDGSGREKACASVRAVARGPTQPMMPRCHPPVCPGDPVASVREHIAPVL